jgi:hypothetical protein
VPRKKMRTFMRHLRHRLQRCLHCDVR